VEPEDAELNGFPHFMLKEIYEQSDTILNASEEAGAREGISKLGGLMPVWNDLKECRNLVIVAAELPIAGCVGKYIFEN